MLSGERLQDHWSSGLCFVVAMCDLVHDVEIRFHLHQLLTGTECFFSEI